jgi:hypothetical protein
MPFDVFSEAMCKYLGCPVYTHEYASSNKVEIIEKLIGKLISYDTKFADVWSTI